VNLEFLKLRNVRQAEPLTINIERRLKKSEVVVGGSATAAERRQKTREGIRSLERLKSDDNRAQVQLQWPHFGKPKHPCRAVKPRPP
jgi:hypothetical protein